MDIKIINTGYCESLERMAIKGGAFKKIRFPAMVAVLKHPQHGVILFDTGYSERIVAATKRFPERIYNWLLPPKLDQHQSAKVQLEQMGIAPEDVKYVIVSHFHGDHTCGLKDFKQAKYVCSTAAFEHLQSLNNRVKATRAAVLLDLIPEDLESRLWLYDKDDKVSTKKQEQLGELYDLFGDESILLMDLSGHMTGQIGALVTTPTERYFLIADACWLSRSFQQNIGPSVAARFVIDDFAAFENSLERIHLFHKAHPKVHIIPTHCEPTVQHYVAKTKNS